MDPSTCTFKGSLISAFNVVNSVAVEFVIPHFTSAVPLTAAPIHSILKVDNNGGAWCPKHMVSRGLKEYLQIDLLQVHVLTAIRTQGRFGKGQGQEYTEAYVVEYWRPGMEAWRRWKTFQGKEILPGNTNTYSEVENVLQPIIFASKVRIYPYSQYDRTVCLRAEVVGCPWE
ncbi:discoidin domain-containing receptor tyrosine kinase B-like, partial [Musca vetustissima]|uniref:discoidin domain-containing receptor tyrosine kinase B-like n=1 Tax=Musca vetustissima TaxID=27455 RepID=UPI002AB6BC8E